MDTDGAPSWNTRTTIYTKNKITIIEPPSEAISLIFESGTPEPAESKHHPANPNFSPIMSTKAPRQPLFETHAPMKDLWQALFMVAYVEEIDAGMRQNAVSKIIMDMVYGLNTMEIELRRNSQQGFNYLDELETEIQRQRRALEEREAFVREEEVVEMEVDEGAKLFNGLAIEDSEQVMVDQEPDGGN